MTLAYGNLVTGLATNFLWNEFNKIIFPKGYNPNGMKLTVKTKDGSFGGGFVDPANPAVKPKITGAVLQNVNMAFGNFPGTTESGSAEVFRND
jgi:hypothetical protein